MVQREGGQQVEKRYDIRILAAIGHRRGVRRKVMFCEEGMAAIGSKHVFADLERKELYLVHGNSTERLIEDLHAVLITRMPKLTITALPSLKVITNRMQSP